MSKLSLNIEVSAS